jgi:hypothetical protein
MNASHLGEPLGTQISGAVLGCADTPFWRSRRALSDLQLAMSEGRGYRARGGATAHAVRRIEFAKKKSPGRRKYPGYGDSLKLWGRLKRAAKKFNRSRPEYRDAWSSATKTPYAGMYAHDSMNSVTSTDWITIHLPSEVKVMAALHPIGMTAMYQVNAASRVIWVTGKPKFRQPFLGISVCPGVCFGSVGVSIRLCYAILPRGRSLQRSHIAHGWNCRVPMGPVRRECLAGPGAHLWRSAPTAASVILCGVQ